MAKTTHKLAESWLSVDIETIEGSKFVTIRSTIHQTKEFLLPHSYSVEFKDAEILRDSDFLKYYARFR